MARKKKIRYIELFAWVGGFRIGLERAEGDVFEAVWSNQWEPSTKTQHASDVYVARFGAEWHSNEDISKVPVESIPEHDMIVGGFPCQDYSVAKSLKDSHGLTWKKGVLWWEIYRIVNEKKQKPKYLLLENVDRLLKSPVKQRGRDFSIMLASLADLGYVIEWRIINAADYGMPQRRRRVFIFAYHESTPVAQRILKSNNPATWIAEEGTIAKEFPVSITSGKISQFDITGSLEELTEEFNKETPGISPFENAGIIIGRTVTTVKTAPNHDGERVLLADVLIPDSEVPEEYFIKESDIPKWEREKGGKRLERVDKATGFKYCYSEGGMLFPDPIDKPSRTIVTGEGWTSASRFKHVIRTKNGRLRRLTPIELERLNMFPDRHTEGVSDVRRAFFMGNALVVGVIEKLGKALLGNAE